uniref:EGF-like domain-containing protein n=1 Tax=Plectus sambesii TaxID=2011161 RepID=A0A914X9W2_9BILA
MTNFIDQRLNVASTVLLLLLVTIASAQSLLEGCGCDLKNRLCDLTTSCEHGVWTTARKFDSTTDMIKYGFCDCETGWSGNVCEYPSAEYESPENECTMNYGQWNGDFCRCSEDTFGRYCQFRLISMQEQNKKCTCGHQRSHLNHDQYLCQNFTIRQNPASIAQIRVLANAQPVIIQPPEVDHLATSSRLATNRSSAVHNESTNSSLSTERGKERNIVEHYELASASPINAWIPICITFMLIAIILCITYIVKVQFCGKRSSPSPSISSPIELTPTQLATAIAITTLTHVKESPPPSYESLEMK